MARNVDILDISSKSVLLYLPSPAAIERAKVHLSSIIITKVSLFVFVIYFSGDPQCASSEK